MNGYTRKANGTKDITFLRDVSQETASKIHANLVKRYSRKEVFRWRYYPDFNNENKGRMTIEWQKPWF